MTTDGFLTIKVQVRELGGQWCEERRKGGMRVGEERDGGEGNEGRILWGGRGTSERTRWTMVWRTVLMVIA